MAKITWKAGTMISPLPAAMISCGTVEKPNVMTASWTGIINSEPAITYVSIRPSRYSYEIISNSGEFVINLTNLALAEATDYCGVKSGKNNDKIKKMGLTMIASEKIAAPQIEQSPVSLECKIIEVKKYGTHDMFIAEILTVNVDDQYIDKAGKLDLEKAGMLVYSHGEYFTMGRKLGSFGWSVNKKLLAEKEKVKTEKVKTVTELTKENEEEVVEKKQDRPRRDSGEGEKRSYKPREGSSSKDRERKSFGDRPQRSFSDRPRRDSGEGEKRSYKPREGSSNKDRERNFGDRPAPVERKSHSKFRNK